MITLNVPNMSCGHCAGVINKTIAGFDPAAKVTIDVPNKTVAVDTQEDVLALREALAEAGYPATPA